MDKSPAEAAESIAGDGRPEDNALLLLLLALLWWWITLGGEEREGEAERVPGTERAP